jgi:hypothetical protein
MKVFAFNVVNKNLDANFLLAHEIGHNLGCCHGPGDEGGCAPGGGAFSYSNGHRFPVDDPQYRTVMTYFPGLVVGHFSNPDVRYEGHPTGVFEGDLFEADNARTIRETAFVVANFGGKCFDDVYDP